MGIFSLHPYCQIGSFPTSTNWYVDLCTMRYCMVLSSQHVLPRGWPFAQDGWHTTTTMELFWVINRLEYHRLQGTSMEHNLVDAKDHVTMAKDHNALVHNQTNTTKKSMTNYLLIYFGICLCCDHHMLSVSNGP